LFASTEMRGAKERDFDEGEGKGRKERGDILIKYMFGSKE